MSSTFSVLCLSRDPAITLHAEHTGQDGALDEIEQGVGLAWDGDVTVALRATP